MKKIFFVCIIIMVISLILIWLYRDERKCVIWHKEKEDCGGVFIFPKIGGFPVPISIDEEECEIEVCDQYE